MLAHGNFIVNVESEIYHTPPREALQQIKPLLSPATMSKNELNDAALTLKWLSEGWNTGDCRGRTCNKGRRLSISDGETPRGSGSNKKSKNVKSRSYVETNTPADNKPSQGMGLHNVLPFPEDKTPDHVSKIPLPEPLSKSGDPPIQLKSKRAASQKCAAMLKEALFEETREKPEKKGFSIPKVSVQKPGKQKRSSPTGGETTRKRSRNYSEKSRVGRAVQAIYKYIIKHQAAYLKKGARGVPERIIRVEYGNNPDTSKALRYLVTENRINREGMGGRKDPFSYTVKSVSAQSFMSQAQSPLLVSLGVPPVELCAASHQNGSNEQIATAVVTSLAEPSTTNVFSPTGAEEPSTIQSRKQVQPRLSFGEPLNRSPGINFDPASKNVRPAKLQCISPLPNFDQKNVIRSTIIEKGGMPTDVQCEKSGQQRTAASSVRAAYLMQMHAAQLLWSQTLMAMNSSQRASENSSKTTVANGNQD